MNGRPVVVDLVTLVRVKQEHAGQWRYSCLRNLRPRIKHRLDVEDRLLTGTNGKAVGTRGARAVEQRVNHNGIRIGLRLLDPERCEDREFLALRIRSIDGQAACGEPISLAFGNRAKIGGAEKDGELVVVVLPVDRVVQAKSRETQVGVRVRRFDVPK